MAGPKKMKGAFGVVSAAASTASAVNGLRTARTDKDRLALANAIGSIIVAITGALIAVRAFRSGK